MMHLTQRAPSSNWEPVPLDPSGQFAAWAWFRPAAVPNGLIFVIPAALFAVPQIAATLSVRRLIDATGLSVSQMLYWSVNGFNFDAAGGSSPMLDQLLPAPSPDGQVHLTVWMNDQPMIPQYESPPASTQQPILSTYQATAHPTGSQSPQDEQLLTALDSNWNSIRLLETKVSSVRKQLDQAASRLNSLNRELTPEERRASDNKDTKDWLDARRWLRDSIAVLGRYIKEIDLGTTSGTGPRHRFEAMYRQYVVPRIPFAGMEQLIIELESHAKSLQNVVAAAQAGLTKAGRDAEQRANGVLMRISAKSRSTRKKN